MEPTDYLKWGPTDLSWQAPVLEPAAVPIEMIPDDLSWQAPVLEPAAVPIEMIPDDLSRQAPVLEPAAVPIEMIPDDFDDPSIIEAQSGNARKFPNTWSRTLAKNTAKTLLGSGYNKESKLVEPFIRKYITDNDIGTAALMGLAYGLPVIGTALDMAEGNIPGLLDITGTAGLFKGPIKAARKVVLPSAIGGSAQGTLSATISKAFEPELSLDDYTQDQIDEWWQDAIRRYK